MTKEIQESEENDKVLSLVLADRIEQSRYSRSLKKACNDLGIEVIA